VSSAGGQRATTYYTTFMSNTSTSYTSTYLSYPYILHTSNAIWQQKGETSWMLDDENNIKPSTADVENTNTYTYIYPTTNDVPQTLK
jgi:hypothetical protein